MKKETQSETNQQPDPHYEILEFYRETEFQETPIGKIPRDWKFIELAHLAQIIMGQSPPSSTYNREGVGMPFLQGKMEFGRIYPFPVMYTIQPLKIAEPNDVLISVRAPVGDVNIAPCRLCIGRGLAAIRFNPEVADYMFYFYYFQLIKKRLEVLGKGSTFKAITKKDLERLKVVQPSVNEQRKIAEILSTVDRAIESIDRNITKLERLKKALMNELLTGRVRVREENGKLIFYRETEFQETPIGKIPRDWKVVKLKGVGKIVSGFTFPLEFQGKISGKYPFIKVKDMNNSYKYIHVAENYVDDEDLVKLKARPYPRNTIIFPKIGMAVRLNKYRILGREALFDNNIDGIIVDDRLAYHEFIYYYLQARVNLISLAGMTTVPSISKSKLENIPLPLPSINEQKSIAEILSTVDRAIELHHKKKELLERLKKGLMDLLLTGKIRVKVKNDNVR